MTNPFRLQHIHDLVEADFREIRFLLKANHQKIYTLDYIRKVCKGERNNEQIHSIALNYIQYINEALERMGKWIESNKDR
ncbi:MAG: hypothetical protein AAF600_20310 [Bacteroidota bacterium]